MNKQLVLRSIVADCDDIRMERSLWSSPISHRPGDAVKTSNGEWDLEIYTNTGRAPQVDDAFYRDSSLLQRAASWGSFLVGRSILRFVSSGRFLCTGKYTVLRKFLDITPMYGKTNNGVIVTTTSCVREVHKNLIHLFHHQYSTVVRTVLQYEVI